MKKKRGAGTKNALPAVYPGRFLEQMQQLKKMGPLNQLMEMMPGMGDGQKA